MKLYLHRLRLRLTGPLRVAKFPGIPLEGAVTAGLRDISCACRGDGALDRCPVERRCMLHRLARPRAEHFAGLPKRFGTPPPPLVLRPRFAAGVYEAGEEVEVEAVVVAEDAAHLPWLVAALASAGRSGIGPSRRTAEGGGRFDVAGAETVGPRTSVSGWGVGAPAGAGPEPWRWPDDFAHPAPPWAAEGCEVRFRSPTVVPRGGPRGSLEFEALVAALASRLSLFALAYAGECVVPREEHERLRCAAAAVRLLERRCRWVEWDRFSGRQGKSFPVGGWTGSVRYGGDVSAFMPLLRLGALLHVGGHAIRGLGEIEPHPPGDVGGSNDEGTEGALAAWSG